MQRLFRLRHNRDFQRVRTTGQTWSHPYLVLGVAPNGLPHNRYGIITPRRLGTAVTRNRIKRRIREAVRYWHPRLSAGHDVVLIARQAGSRCTYPELLEAVRVLFQRAGLLL